MHDGKGGDSLTRVVPFDVSETMLVGAAEEINAAYDVPVVAVVGDFRQHLDKIPTDRGPPLWSYFLVPERSATSRRASAPASSATLQADAWTK